MSKLRKGERIIGRKGFKVDEISEDARGRVLELMNKGVSYEKISQTVDEVYGEKVSAAALCRYNRNLKEQIDLAAERTRYIRECSKAAMEKLGDEPDVDIGKFLTMRVEGELLTYINSIDVQGELAGLRFDKIATIMQKLGEVTVKREALLWRTKIDKALQKLDEKAKQAAEQAKEERPSLLSLDGECETQLKELIFRHGKDYVKNCLVNLGIMPTKNVQGLDPETLKTIREEIYGIFK